ncbi:PDZ domain-containing protein [Sporosarcina pasteurii]|uniref:Cell division topological determinant MinJ n=1 Tax=Sporosarcina pasteurii TaxID=1474 RepID=A0A380BF21_SPOPA|nr:PDZ domain-containing protein [Sporosarcina pasteurii]MDS9470347.1 PDZ domain-containing protein [Sporosarcina pasteurii]QBQ05943.1 PDZ domain-containing protein [Sporosarcina pasteurii]SUI99848.1 Cell division topological determinant MinJ [Sporosarcina pasteurii]
MGKEVFSEVLLSVSLFLLNPLLIVALIVAILLGYFRVKRERRSFRVRMLPGFTELRRIISESWLHAIVLSILISGIGLVVDAGWLVVFCTLSILVLLTFNYKLTSPVYLATIAFFSLYATNYFAEDFVFRGWEVGAIDFFGELTITIPVITGMLLVAEGLLIYKYGDRDSSSHLIQTKRGLQAGVFKAKKLWLLPVLFLVPGEMIGTYLPYWPQFPVGESAFTFVPVPLVIGFSQIARANFPKDLFPQIGRAIAFIGVVVIAAGIAAIWMPVLGWAALLSGFAGRVIVSVVVSIQERRGGYVLAPQSKGVVIAGVIPNSPGEKMGLLAGERIQSVNGQAVHNEKELYDAIQVNAAHCRLQVVDRDGEVRLMQQVVYRHDHHRLGILVVQ